MLKRGHLRKYLRPGRLLPDPFDPKVPVNKSNAKRSDGRSYGPLLAMRAVFLAMQLMITVLRSQRDKRPPDMDVDDEEEKETEMATEEKSDGDFDEAPVGDSDSEMKELSPEPTGRQGKKKKKKKNKRQGQKANAAGRGDEKGVQDGKKKKKGIHNRFTAEGPSDTKNPHPMVEVIDTRHISEEIDGFVENVKSTRIDNALNLTMPVIHVRIGEQTRRMSHIGMKKFAMLAYELGKTVLNTLHKFIQKHSDAVLHRVWAVMLVHFGFDATEDIGKLRARMAKVLPDYYVFCNIRANCSVNSQHVLQSRHESVCRGKSVSQTSVAHSRSGSIRLCSEANCSGGQIVHARREESHSGCRAEQPAHVWMEVRSKPRVHRLGTPGSVLGVMAGGHEVGKRVRCGA